MKHIFSLILSLFVLSACSLQPIETGSNPVEITITSENPAPDLASLCQQKGYTWNADSTCTRTETGQGYTITIHYPIELLPSSLVENTIDPYLAEYQAEFLQDFATGYQPEIAPWSLEIAFAVYRHSTTVSSVQFIEAHYTGGVHPNMTFRTFTFDSAANQVLGFEDLFTDVNAAPPELIPMIRQQLASSMSANGIPVDVNDVQLVSGTSELTHFQDFALTESELIIFFEPYQVASYAAGPQEASIPLSDLSAFLRDF